jgi:hypothetical protein
VLLLQKRVETQVIHSFERHFLSGECYQQRRTESGQLIAYPP